MMRVAAHRITFEGAVYEMSVIELADDGHTVAIYPLTHEIHSTRFVSGHIVVAVVDGKLSIARP